MRATVAAVFALTGMMALRSATAYAAGQPPSTDPSQLRTELWAAIGAQGKDYREFRDRLLKRGEAIRPFVRQTAKNGKTWQERTMAAILLERLTKPERIQAVVEWWARAEVHRAHWVNLKRLGKSLAKECADTPMLLVEKIWKNNELRNKGVLDLQDGAWAADALGWLADERAVHPLILVLEAEYEYGPQLLRVLTAARALGNYAHPKAVPALCRACVLYSGDPAGAYSADALAKCVDRRSSHIVDAHARWVRDSVVKSVLIKIASAGKTKSTRRSRRDVIPER